MIPAESSDLTVQVPNGRRSWSLTDESGLRPIFGGRFSRVVENVRSYGGTRDRTIGHVCHKRSSFPLDESRYTRGYEFIRLYSVSSEGGRLLAAAG